ncbi:FAD-binding oxidoreductase [Mumia sp. zg.B53]|uniref:FAD-binding oxidoreductase n=1 Tax=Mumia sp. zg.B53 TaxID=2855449 RepID=UPI001C6EE6D0|nr:FAD-binding oxidoreductase [Mumia sp. zg.B53]MBW9214045.1 FAD-binding oxidoreductase [Mumia sp. zg.B53]
MSELALPVVEFAPDRWGNPAHATGLSPATKEALDALGVRPRSVAVAPEDVVLPGPAVPASARTALEAAVGAAYVSDEEMDRLRHTRGWSTPDILRMRAGDVADAPDLVVRPGSHDEVVRVLQVCSEAGVAVVPYSGGTSVVGGLAPEREGFAGVVALDLARLDAPVALDPVSRTATLQAGMRGLRAEELLQAEGFTLGHFPQSYEGASLGGYAAARSAGQSSAGYGRFDEMVVGLVLATPRGTLELGTAPKSASGPDLRQLVLGSEGVLGVITSLTVRVRPVPRERVFEGWRFPSFGAGLEAVRRLAQDGPLPTVLRLSDEAETAINLADPSGGPAPGEGGCLAITGYEGDPEDVAVRRGRATAVLQACGGEPLGLESGEAWRRGRFHGPYQRDPLLDAGAFVETLETVTFWSNVPRLKAAVTEAVQGALGEQGTPAIVLCHVSHVYETGASLYFTIACAQADDPLAQWAPAKAAANAAIRAAGAAISHHHGVGTDHRAPYAEEIGPLGVEVLRAVKATLDPAGILNPGVLVAR